MPRRPPRTASPPFGQGIEHRLQIEGRPADHLEHVAGRGLVFQRSLSSRVRACTSSNRRAFSIAMTAWSAKVLTSSICLSGEWLDGSRRCKHDDADRNSFSKKRYAEHRAKAEGSLILGVCILCDRLRHQVI